MLTTTPQRHTWAWTRSINGAVLLLLVWLAAARLHFRARLSSKHINQANRNDDEAVCGTAGAEVRSVGCVVCMRQHHLVSSNHSKSGTTPSSPAKVKSITLFLQTLPLISHNRSNANLNRSAHLCALTLHMSAAALKATCPCREQSKRCCACARHVLRKSACLRTRPSGVELLMILVMMPRTRSTTSPATPSPPCKLDLSLCIRHPYSFVHAQRQGATGPAVCR